MSDEPTSTTTDAAAESGAAEEQQASEGFAAGMAAVEPDSGPAKSEEKTEEKADPAKSEEKADPAKHEEKADPGAELKELQGKKPEELTGTETLRLRELTNDGEAASRGKADDGNKEEDFRSAVREIHPDLDAITASPQFAAWLKAQPKRLQDRLNNATVDEAAMILDMFKASVPKTDHPANSSELPDEVMSLKFKTVDDNGKPVEKTVKQFFEEYGEVAGAVVAIAQAMAGKKQDPGPNAELGELRKTVAALENSQRVLSFWRDVSAGGHPDGESIANSAKFKEWKAKQSDYVKRRCDSGRSQDAVDVLDAYKDAMAREVSGEDRAKAKKRKEQLDALHGETVRGRTADGGRDGDEDAAAASSAFAAGARAAM